MKKRLLLMMMSMLAVAPSIFGDVSTPGEQRGLADTNPEARECAQMSASSRSGVRPASQAARQSTVGDRSVGASN